MAQVSKFAQKIPNVQLHLVTGLNLQEQNMDYEVSVLKHYSNISSDSQRGQIWQILLPQIVSIMKSLLMYYVTFKLKVFLLLRISNCQQAY